MNWKDESSWSKSDDAAARANPKTWVARTISVTCIATRRHGAPPTSWFISAAPFFELVELLGDITADEAKRRCEARLAAGVECLRREVSR